MFINKLIIKTNIGDSRTIRNISFHKGLNLIVDDSTTTEQTQTGNGVGKTSVLRLIDFCLGANNDVVFKVDRREREENTTVKKFLEEYKVSVELELQWESELHTFSRSFVKLNNFSKWIDGKGIKTEKEYKEKIDHILYPGKKDKPSFRQILSHHIRYKEPGMDSTLRTLHQNTKDVEYETLYFYMLGIYNNENASDMQKLEEDLKIERKQLNRLTTSNSMNDIVLFIESIDRDIQELEKEKNNFGIDVDTVSDINELDTIKREINQKSSAIERLNIRISILEDSINSVKGEISNIDMESLRNIYEDTKKISKSVLHDFSNLVEYHNKLAESRKRYLENQLPSLHEKIERIKKDLYELQKKEAEIKRRITRRDSYSEISDIISQLNEKYMQKGKYENQLELIRETMEKVEKLEASKQKINSERNAIGLRDRISECVKEFNKDFSFISRELYGEDYVLSFDDPNSKCMHYKFKILSMDNFSTGKKQGEIICFDMSYIIYADKHSIPCMHFLLNDKKELMHNNPLRRIAEFASGKDMQLVFPILRDKIPQELLDDEHIILTLSQNEKLLRMEQICKELNS